MSGISAFFRAVRERWHLHRCPDVDQTDLPVYERGPGVQTTRHDLDVRRDAYRPPAGIAASELRINRMMQAFHVDRRELEQDFPGVLRDAEITCARCRLKRQCFRELERGTAVANAEHFCPNADLLMIFANDEEAVRQRRLN